MERQRRRDRLDPLRLRVRSMRASRSYDLVLVLIVASFFFTALAPSSHWSLGALLLIQAGTLLLARWRSRSGPPQVAVGIVVLTAVVATALVVTNGRVTTTVAGACCGLFVIWTAVVIGRGVVSEPTVNQQSVIGAICVYVLLGMVFLFAYGVVAALGSQPFFAQGTDGSLALRLYFSFVTLTTVGYGDYTTASNIGHTLSVVEALIGQLYLVTVIAVLVSRVKPRADRSSRR
jgi:hypothetical protein